MKPSDILPDDTNSVELQGRTLRKGSVAAFVANVKLLESDTTSPDERVAAARDLKELAPVLRDLGLFDVFSVRSAKIQDLVDEALS
jgi:hypothetical protein